MTLGDRPPAQRGTYPATERKWVARILARLSPDQRARYEAEMKQASGHPHSGKKFDILKAEIAERILQQDARRGP